MIARSERQKRVDEFEGAFADAVGIYLTDFTGVDVEKITKLRSELRAAGARYIVVKNSLARIALTKCGIEGLTDYVKGPVGVAVIKEDATAPAKIIRDFNKEHKDLLNLRAAYVEGTVFEAQDALRLADLPSRDVLLSQLLSCLQAPMTNLAGSLNGIMSKFVRVVAAVRDKKEQEG
ncbi:MAG: 50S ribosomal protein L10 [Chitinivibrionales bacterium]|nr:50S ribosomal protein L10 [Chitinivibrionales bacterium]MBD3356192.1 50S ribosomal protein L10 [Chitinivibrionales bacterium]